jgi:hypothetical protein
MFTYGPKKSFISLVHEKLFWLKNVFYALVEKYFFYPTVAIFFINKKVAQYALLYTQKKLQPQNRK